MCRMTKTGKAKPTKVELSPDAKAAIARLLPQIQAERDNYQIGVGTLVAELVEKLVVNPEVIQQLLTITETERESSSTTQSPPKPDRERRPKKKAA